MAEHKVGNTVVLVGTIVEIQGDVALVQVDRSFPSGTTTIAVRLGKLPDGDVPSDKDRIRDAMTEATDHPGCIVITCTQHGAVNCPCLSAPAGGSAPTAAHPPGRVITR